MDRRSFNNIIVLGTTGLGAAFEALEQSLPAQTASTQNTNSPVILGAGPIPTIVTDGNYIVTFNDSTKTATFYTQLDNSGSHVDATLSYPKSGILGIGKGKGDNYTIKTNRVTANPNAPPAPNDDAIVIGVKRAHDLIQMPPASHSVTDPITVIVPGSNVLSAVANGYRFDITRDPGDPETYSYKSVDLVPPKSGVKGFLSKTYNGAKKDSHLGDSYPPEVNVSGKIIVNPDSSFSVTATVTGPAGSKYTNFTSASKIEVEGYVLDNFGDAVRSTLGKARAANLAPSVK